MRRHRSSKRAKPPLGLVAACVFIAVVVLAVVVEWLPPIILGAYLALSALAFGLYAWDKSAAKRRAWRTQERTLHLLALVGGWPGAMIAQRTLRHKNKKRAFQRLFWVTVALNVSVFIWLLTPSATALLQWWAVHG